MYVQTLLLFFEVTDTVYKVIPSDYSGQLSLLLRYPSDHSSSPVHISLLLQQAQALKSSPTPSTGASVVIQNRNILGIPVEVPDPPTPARRSNPNRNRPGQGSQTVRLPRNGSPLGDFRKEFGFPDIIAKGLLDVNGVISSTVSEIRVSGIVRILI